jgi:hypothetical protein
MSKKTTATKTDSSTPVKKGDFVFGKNNYRLLLIGIAVIIIGFVLMTGTENILDFRKITLAPIVIVAGFATVAVAILQKPKD